MDATPAFPLARASQCIVLHNKAVACKHLPPRGPTRWQQVHAWHTCKQRQEPAKAFRSKSLQGLVDTPHTMHALKWRLVSIPLLAGAVWELANIE